MDTHSRGSLIGLRDPLWCEGLNPAYPCLREGCTHCPVSLAPLCRDFKIEDGRAVIPLGVTMQGDVLLVIYHARSTLGGRLQAKVSLGPHPMRPHPGLPAHVTSTLHGCLCPPTDGIHEDVPDPVPHRVCASERNNREVCQVCCCSASCVGKLWGVPASLWYLNPAVPWVSLPLPGVDPVFGAAHALLMGLSRQTHR